MLVTLPALAALVAAAPGAAPMLGPAVDVWRVEVPVVLTASAPASNVETTVLPWLSVRVGRRFSLGGDLGASLGVDGALLCSAARAGTSQIATTRLLAAAEARALFSPGRVASTYTVVEPYAFAGLLGGGGAVLTKVFAQGDARPLGTWGARAGLGGLVAIHGVTTSIELAAGVRDLRFELSSALALGFTF